MSGQAFDRESTLEVVSRNLDDPPTDQSQSELVELLRNDTRTRDTWVAEVALDEILRIHFEESRGRSFDERISRLAKKESRRHRRRTLFKVLGVSGGLAATMLVLIALLLPAVQQARPAHRRSTTRDNLKQIGLALHNFEAEHGGFPLAFSKDGRAKPLLSWRVFLLPYLDEQELFNQFHLNEPWDSPHNLTLMNKMPAAYRSPYDSRDDHTAYLAVPLAEGVIRPPTAADAGMSNPVGVIMSEVRDGLSNTVMVVEVADELAVPWTRPHDYPVASGFDDSTLPSVSRALEAWESQNRVICDRVVLADGTVREVSGGVSKAVITRSGGEILTDSDW